MLSSDLSKLKSQASSLLRQRTVVFLMVFAVCSVVTISCMFWSVMNISAGLSRRSVLLLLLPLFAVLCILFGALLQTRHDCPEIVFLLIGIPAVFMFGLFILPGAIPDEGPHIWQAAALTTRNSSGFSVPAILSEEQLPKTYADALYLLSEPNTWASTFTCERYLGSYFFHLYAFPGLVLEVGHFLNINALLCVMIGRVLNGAVFLIAGYWMIRSIPSGKTALFVFLLNPILIQQEASCSADAIANVVALCFVVYVVKLNSEDEIYRSQYVCLFFLSAGVLVSKLMFAPLILLCIIFTKRLSNMRIERKGIAISACMLVVAACLTIIFYHGSFMPEAFDLLRDPLRFTSVMVKSIWEMGPFWFSSYAGANLGALSINVWGPCFWMYIILQSVVLFYFDDDNSNGKLAGSDKCLFCLIALVNFVLIVLSMRGWTLTVDKRSDIIMGVQGRYLFPLALLCLLSIQRAAGPSSKGNVVRTSALILAGIFAIDMISIVQFFWG